MTIKMVDKQPDFSGWATRYNVLCSDGRTIKTGAFAHNDKTKVPLVWQHTYMEPSNILGHAILHNRDEGVYAEAFFNDTETANVAKQVVAHGDITSLSIHANNLKERNRDVFHGDIKELSLVLAGANPESYIDYIAFAHGEDDHSEAIIYTADALTHEDSEKEEEVAEVKNDERTVQDVLDTFDEDQTQVLEYLVSEALENGSKKEETKVVTEEVEEVKHSDLEDSEENTLNHSHQEGASNMTRNVFDQTENTTPAGGATLTHSQLETIMRDAKSLGSLSESFLQHSQEYGIENIDVLFPDAKNLTTSPEFIKRRTEWVQEVLGKSKHSPFSRLKTIFADITAEEARARGYVKNTMKKDEIISLLKRVTTPVTVYKKQRLDRDDIIDITDLDVVTWLKAEMRLMLDEELARAILLGDGRTDDGEDTGKIPDPAGSVNAAGIRSIANDDDMYNHKVTVHGALVPGTMVDEALRARVHYRGTGTPTLFTTDSILTDMLLEKDKMGRRLYKTVEELAGVIRVANIVPVEVMESYPEILGIMVNMQDYTVGADKGGQISMFDDFDIDWNQYKYLIETRLSGALTKPKSAITFIRTLASQVIPEMPGFLDDTITIPNKEGVEYYIDSQKVTGDVAIEETTTVDAFPAEGYVFPNNITTSWTFTYVEG